MTVTVDPVEVIIRAERGLLERDAKYLPNAAEVVAELETKGAKTMGRPIGEMTKKAAAVWEELANSAVEPITGDQFAEALGTDRMAARRAFYRAQEVGLIPATAQLQGRRMGPPPGTPPKNVSRVRPVPSLLKPAPSPAATTKPIDPRYVDLAAALREELERLESRKAEVEALLEDLAS